MEAVASVLSRVLHRLGLENEILGWRAVEEWPQVVGPRIARHARAVSFREGTLVVEVDGSAWMQELSYLKRDLVRKANRHLGSELVRHVKFVIPRGGILR